MTNAWNDFNDARQNANLIPKGTIAKVRLTIRPGGFDDPAQGWTGGYARRGSTGSVFLDCEYTVLEGQYAKRKIWSMIGLYSATGPNWANMGRSLVRGILNSARGLSDKDNSAEAQNARRIASFADLDGIEFIARIDVGHDGNGEEKNDIRQAITRDHKDYAAFMAGMSGHASAGHGLAPLASQPAYAPPMASVGHVPAHQPGQPAYQPSGGHAPAPQPSQPVNQQGGEVANQTSPSAPGSVTRPSWA